MAHLVIEIKYGIPHIHWHLQQCWQINWCKYTEWSLVFIGLQLYLDILS